MCHLVKNDGVELVQRDGIIDGVYVVKTPRANAKHWGLGDFEGERKAAEGRLCKRSLAALANLDPAVVSAVTVHVEALSFLRVQVDSYSSVASA